MGLHQIRLDPHTNNGRIMRKLKLVALYPPSCIAPDVLNGPLTRLKPSGEGGGEVKRGYRSGGSSRGVRVGGTFFFVLERLKAEARAINRA